MYRPAATTTTLPPSLPPHNHFFHPPCCLLGFSYAADDCKSSMMAIIPSPMSVYIIFEMEDQDFEISSHPRRLWTRHDRTHYTTIDLDKAGVSGIAASTVAGPMAITDNTKSSSDSTLTNLQVTEMAMEEGRRSSA